MRQRRFKYTEALVKPESHCLRAAGREVSQASDDSPLHTVCDSAVSAASPNLWCVDGRQMEVHTSGCQECQVAAMWRRIFFVQLWDQPKPPKLENSSGVLWSIESMERCPGLKLRGSNVAQMLRRSYLCSPVNAGRLQHFEGMFDHKSKTQTMTRDWLKEYRRAFRSHCDTFVDFFLDLPQVSCYFVKNKSICF